MNPADARDMLPVPTALEDIEIGDEITTPPSFVERHLTVRNVGTEIVHGESGAGRTVWHLTLELIDNPGECFQHDGERLDTVIRWVPLDDIAEAFRWRLGDPEDRNDAPIVVPALISEVRRLREEIARRDARLDESRRMRGLAEDAFGGRRPGGAS